MAGAHEVTLETYTDRLSTMDKPEHLISHFPGASQNIMVVTLLLCNMPEPSNSQG
jgi:hypothetical protein